MPWRRSTAADILQYRFGRDLSAALRPNVPGQGSKT
jgi:hypothetical protein